jgi:DNA-directed RNA polymerase subunit E'/Rpb7
MTTDDLYVLSTFNITGSVKPNNIPKNKLDLDKLLLSKIKNKLGNKCIHYGYIDKDSIQILERSIGNVNSAHFNGEIYYNVKIQIKLCSPSVNQVIKCRVIGKNQAGIFCVAPPLQIMLSPENHDDTSRFDSIKKNDNIKIKVAGYKILLNHDHIKVLGQLV